MSRTSNVPANTCWWFIMPDFSLVPVDHQPDFSDVSLVPVDHDPFSIDDAIGQSQSQIQTQPAETQPESSPQQPAMEVAQFDLGQPFRGDGRPDGSYDHDGYVPSGLDSSGSGGHVKIQNADFVIPDSGPTVPSYEQNFTGAEAAQAFANGFKLYQAAGYPTVGDASFGAVAQSNIGIIAVGPNSITSTQGITAYDGNRQMYFEPTNADASITVSIDPVTRSISVVQNPGRRA